MTIPIFVFNDIGHFRCLDRAGATDRLISYYYLNNRGHFGKGSKYKKLRDKALLVQYDRGPENFYLLDSGAFSAWRQGVIIGIYQYIEAIHQVQDLFTHFVCLDVINDPIMSEANHRIMLEEGCHNVMPVFHSGESINVLQYMVAQGYKFIGISPNNDWAENRKVKWLVDVWQQVDLSNTMTHGFGYMGKLGLSTVPLTTADSAAWIFNGAMGAIHTPLGMVYVTERMLKNAKHISRLPDYERLIIDEWIEKIEIHTLKEMHDHHYPRKAFNVKAIPILVKDLVKDRCDITTATRTGTLFSDIDSSGFGYTEPFTEEAVEQAVKDIKSGKTKQIPLSDRKTSPPKHKEVKGPLTGRLF